MSAFTSQLSTFLGVLLWLWHIDSSVLLLSIVALDVFLGFLRVFQRFLSPSKDFFDVFVSFKFVLLGTIDLFWRSK